MNIIVTWSGQTLAERHGLEGERVEIACSTRKVNAMGEARSRRRAC